MLHFRVNDINKPFWHDKAFTLEWQLEDCKWVLIHYINGQKKRWYKRTERSYRFKRWFIKKNKDEFSNLANIHFPKVVVYIFPWYVSWPKKKVIQMVVKSLYIQENPMKVYTPKSTINSPSIDLISSQPNSQSPVLNVRMPNVDHELNVDVCDNNVAVLAPTCDWPISDWIEQGLVNDKNIEYNCLQKFKTI